MSSNNKKTILLEVPAAPEDENSASFNMLFSQDDVRDDTLDYQVNPPNFAYLAIDSVLIDILAKGRAMLKDSDFQTVTRMSFFVPHFVYDGQVDGDSSIHESNPQACTLVVSMDDFWLEVRHEDDSPFLEMKAITFNELEAMPYDHELEKIPMGFLGKPIKGDCIHASCQLNPRSGELEIEAADASSAASFLERYVISAEGTRYRVFKNEGNDRLFVAPRDLEYLLQEQQQSASPRP